MAEHRDRDDGVMSGVWGVLRNAADEAPPSHQPGISISELFEQLGDAIKNDEGAKTEIWAGLVTRHDVIEVGKQLPLNQSPLRLVAVEFLLEYGLGGTKIRLQGEKVPAEEQVPVEEHVLPVKGNAPAEVNAPVEENAPGEEKEAAEENETIQESVAAAAQEQVTSTNNECGDVPEQQLVTSIESDIPQETAESQTPRDTQTLRSRQVRRQPQTSPGATPKRRGRPPRRSIYDQLVQQGEKELAPASTPLPHDYVAGDPGVYIDPPGSELPAEARKSGEGSCIAVFKSAALKDPQRLENGKGSWKSHIMLAVAKAKLALEDKVAANYTAAGRLKKPGRPRNDATQKRKRNHRGDPGEDGELSDKEQDPKENSGKPPAGPPPSPETAHAVAEEHGNQLASEIPPPSPALEMPGPKKRQKGANGQPSVRRAPVPASSNPWDLPTTRNKGENDKSVEVDEHDAMLRGQSYPYGAQAMQEATAAAAPIILPQPETQIHGPPASASRPVNPNDTSVSSSQPDANQTSGHPFRSESPAGSYRSIYGSQEPQSPVMSALGMGPRRPSFPTSFFQRSQTPSALQPFPSTDSPANPLSMYGAGNFSALSGFGRIQIGTMQALTGAKPTGFLSPSVFPNTSSTALPGNAQHHDEPQTTPSGYTNQSVPPRPISPSTDSATTEVLPTQKPIAQTLSSNESQISGPSKEISGLPQPADTSVPSVPEARGGLRGNGRGRGKTRGGGQRRGRSGKLSKEQPGEHASSQPTQTPSGSMQDATTTETSPLPTSDSIIEPHNSLGGARGKGRARGRGAARGRARGGSRGGSSVPSMSLNDPPPPLGTVTADEQPSAALEIPQALLTNVPTVAKQLPGTTVLGIQAASPMLEESAGIAPDDAEPHDRSVRPQNKVPTTYNTEVLTGTTVHTPHRDIKDAKKATKKPRVQTQASLGVQQFSEPADTSTATESNVPTATDTSIAVESRAGPQSLPKPPQEQESTAGGPTTVAPFIPQVNNTLSQVVNPTAVPVVLKGSFGTPETAASHHPAAAGQSADISMIESSTILPVTNTPTFVVNVEALSPVQSDEAALQRRQGLDESADVLRVENPVHPLETDTLDSSDTQIGSRAPMQTDGSVVQPANLVAIENGIPQAPAIQAEQAPVDPDKSKKRKLSEVADDNSTQEPPQKKPVSKIALRKIETAKLQADISEAEAVEIRNCTARFSCSYEEKIGNLLLSNDQKIVEFFSLDQHPPQMSILSLRVSKLIGNPVVSMKGSYPMGLHLKVLRDDKTDVTHRFIFAATEAGNTAAANMRCAITGAIVLLTMEGGDYETIQETKIAGEKPFQCHLCKGRFKNPNGLEYHLNKARSSCNPNFVEDRDLDKRSLRHLNSGKPRTTKKKKTVQWKPAEDEEDDLGIDLIDNAEEKASSGDESIVEWWEKNNTAALDTPQNARNARRPGKRYMALNREGDIASEITSELPEIGLVENGPLPDNFIKLDLVTASGVAEAMSCNELNEAWYQEVVVSLVKNHGNVFAADRSVWFASVAVWLKQHPVTNVLPESKFCAKAIDDLVQAKSLNRLNFSYTSRRSRVATRGIITCPSLDVDNARVDHLKTVIQVYDPQFYVPSQFAPSQPILDKLQIVAARALPRLPVVETIVDEESEPSPDLQAGVSDDFLVDDEESSAEDEFVIDDNEEAEEDEPDFDEDVEEDLDMGTSSKKRRRRSSKSPGPFTRKRDPNHNAKIAAGVRRRMAAIRSGAQPSPYPWNIKRASLTKEEKDRRAAEDKKFFKERAAYRAVQQQCWGNTPAFMPNTTTGAWDQGGPPSKPEKPAGMSKRTRHARRPHLPEPVTFMQAMDGSWSVRPFGHGVNPVYGRPARRAAGSLGYEAYRKKREDGHRPLIEPPVSNRVHLPQPPSKRLMDAIKKGAPLDPETGLPKRKPRGGQRRNSQRATSTPYSDYEFDDYWDEDSEDFEVPPAKRQRTVDASPGKLTEQPRAEHSRGVELISPGPDNLLDVRVPSVRLSRATGKPVRMYNRHFPKQVFVQELDAINDAFEPKGSRFVHRNGSKRLKGLSEVDILNFYEPKKLGHKDAMNPGLNTMPAGFGLSGSERNKAGGYPSKFEFMAFVEPDIVAEGKDPFVGSWTVDRMDTSNSKDYTVRWDDITSFTLEDLPYDKLEGDDSERLEWTYEKEKEEVEVEVAKAKVKRKRTVKPSTFPTASSKQKQDEKYNFTRIQTALPSDLSDILDPAIASRVFGVEIGTPNEVTVKKSRNLGSNVLLSELENRFIVTVTVIRTLTGGLDAQIDWVLVAEMFSQYSLNFLAKTWKNLLAVKKPAIKELEEEFRKVFLEAYQSGEIPPLNFNKLTEYPWSTLIDWVMENVESSLSNKKIPLPGTKAELDSTYEVVAFKENEKEIRAPWREYFYHPSMAVYKRFEGAASEALTVPVGSKSRIKDEIDHPAVIRSWIRAAAATPDAQFDAAVAKSKMDSFRPTDVRDAINECVDNKCITRRRVTKPVNGKTFSIPDTWTTKFRRHIKDPQFVEAVMFKRWMDAQFRSGVQCIKGDYFANEGALMVLTSLQAHGRLSFVGVNVPKNRFGLGDGGYETKKIPKEAFIWDIDIYPTESYVFDDENPVLQRFGEVGPPRGGNSGEIPIWFSIKEEVVPEMWNRIFAGVAQVVALRAGIGLEGLKSSFKEALEDWEWKLICQWGVAMGVFVEVGGGEETGAVEGYSAGEWWWAVVGAGCADMLQRQAPELAEPAPTPQGGQNQREDVAMGGV
ncbi:uncharacterized protein L3040_004023 [Drepanopeziza brunnea f. sp. 'multigermtubi']|uniref:uncharacterized protein n=1 Tax=Drepanopeziza brunnea f. sp. 'multigermtubi' TaxID=698441 RepID=UPI00238B89AB|nr:hypothetical protein L3040_004023 [Drepanopeziza brunnea f. sp. 'multigermtubi']